MNANILKQILIPLILLLAMWASSELVVMRQDYRNAIIGTIAFLLVFLLIARRVPLDYKLIMIAFMGYCIGGRGFAYLSPANPIFIGEITLALGMFGFMRREVTGWRLHRWTGLHFILFVYLGYSTIHMFIDYPLYKLLAIRDYSMAYYSLYFFVVFAMLGVPKMIAIFKKLFVPALYAGIIGRILLEAGLPQYLILNVSRAFSAIYLPHADILVPLNVAATVYFSTQLSRNGGLKNIILVIICLGIIAIGKTAGVLALVVVIMLLTFWGRLTELWRLLFISASISILAISVISIYDSDLILGSALESGTVQAFNMDDADITARGGSSTQWRMNWWSTIWHETMDYNALLGQGWGADISTSFFFSSGVGDLSEAYLAALPRYPHNIIFTIIGRIGLVGLVIFIIYILAVLKLSYQFCVYAFRGKSWESADLIAFCIFFAGFVNSFVQATYEPPHGAIPHWICLAYIARRVYDMKVAMYNNANSPAQLAQ